MFFVAALLVLSGCTVSGGIYSAGGGWGQQVPVQVPAGHFCGGRPGQKCVFQTQVCGTSGVTRLNQTITFRQGGRTCHADGVNDQLWHHLQWGGCLQVTAYHY